MSNRADLESIHKFCTRNRELLERSERAGCFYCQTLFEPSEILDWIPERAKDSDDLDSGVTALCPRCGIDSVLPAAAPIHLTTELLTAMNQYWFQTSRPFA